MTLRLTDDETDALREYSRATGRSMQDVARQAVRDYVSDRTRRRAQILKRIVAEDGELLALLGELGEWAAR